MIHYNTHISDLIEIFRSENGYDEVFVLTDSNTLPIFLKEVNSGFSEENIFVVPAGEQHKNITTAQTVWAFLANRGASRASVLINFGGGMITDLGGFCASTYMRGISFINIPTTLLAMVDASTGGKTGVNFQNLKNYIGTFTDAQEIIIDVKVLKELPDAEITNGWAEVIKHGIIDGGDLWQLVKAGIPSRENLNLWTEIIQLNLACKQDIVRQDARESGIRKVLNLGHSIGHAIEACFFEHKLLISHGHAVALGTIIETIIAENSGIAEPDLVNMLKGIIYRNFPKIDLSDYTEEITELVKTDKKNRDSLILMALPESIGSISTDVEVSSDEIQDALNFYNEN